MKGLYIKSNGVKPVKCAVDTSRLFDLATDNRFKAFCSATVPAETVF